MTGKLLTVYLIFMELPTVLYMHWQPWKILLKYRHARTGDNSFVQIVLRVVNPPPYTLYPCSTHLKFHLLYLSITTGYLLI